VLCAHVGVVEDAERLKVDSTDIVAQTEAVRVVESTSVIPEGVVYACVLRDTAEQGDCPSGIRRWLL